MKELRKEKMLSQRKFGKEIKYTHSTISDWEVGKSIPSLITLIVIARFFEVSIDYLAGLEDELGNKITAL